MARRTWLVILVGILAIQAGCAGPITPQSQGDALTRVNKTDTLRAAFINYPPSMTVSPDGKTHTGIMHEVMTAAAKNLGVKLDYVEETTWATMVEAVETGRVDVVVSGIWPSTARARHADFSTAVYFSPVYAYVRAGDTRFDEDLASISAKHGVIATIDGELSAIIAASDYPGAKTLSLPNTTDVSQLLLQLTTHKADVTFVEGAVAHEFMAKNPGTVQRIQRVDAVRMFPNTFLFKKGEVNLRSTLDTAVAELHSTGTIAKLLERYDPEGSKFVKVRSPGL